MCNQVREYWWTDFVVVIFMKVVYIRWITKAGKLVPHEIQRNKVQANNLEEHILHSILMK